jgi:hypothetical protein
MGSIGEKCVYAGVLKGMCVHIEKHVIQGSYNEQNMLGLSIVVFLSMGHYPYYESPDLTIIKASKYWFSLQGFSKGFFLKIFVSCV